jgi:hypothetical protein
VLEEYSTGEQRSVVRFLWAKGFSVKDIHKDMLNVYGGKCYAKRFTTGRIYSLKDVQKSQIRPDQVRKRPRQQSNDFNAAGFNAMVKR